MSVINPDSSGRRARRRNILLWIVQGVVAALFLFTGVIKLTMPIAMLAQVSKLPGAFMRSSQWPNSSVPSAWCSRALADQAGPHALGCRLPADHHDRRTFLTAANQGIAAATLPFVVGGC